ncbi:hypothetical protein ARMSODRAFT_1023166, partial [Armillaria solidipes]
MSTAPTSRSPSTHHNGDQHSNVPSLSVQPNRTCLDITCRGPAQLRDRCPTGSPSLIAGVCDSVLGDVRKRDTAVVSCGSTRTLLEEEADVEREYVTPSMEASETIPLGGGLVWSGREFTAYIPCGVRLEALAVEADAREVLASDEEEELESLDGGNVDDAAAHVLGADFLVSPKYTPVQYVPDGKLSASQRKKAK